MCNRTSVRPLHAGFKTTRMPFSCTGPKFHRFFLSSRFFLPRIGPKPIVPNQPTCIGPTAPAQGYPPHLLQSVFSDSSQSIEPTGSSLFFVRPILQRGMKADLAVVCFGFFPNVFLMFFHSLDFFGFFSQQGGGRESMRYPTGPSPTASTSIGSGLFGGPDFPLGFWLFPPVVVGSPNPLTPHPVWQANFNRGFPTGR